jgi:hypothetical protein
MISVTKSEMSIFCQIFNVPPDGIVFAADGCATGLYGFYRSRRTSTHCSAKLRQKREPLAKLSSVSWYASGHDFRGAEKLGNLGIIDEKRPSAAKATFNLIGFTRGINPPSPSVSRFSAACSVLPQMDYPDSGFSRCSIANK